MNRTELAGVVLDLLEKETGETYRDLAETASLREDLNLDSLDMAGLVLHIESHFGIQIETELLESIDSVGRLLDVLQDKLAAKTVRRAA
ncbi:MAG: acyl carrier protein [Pirellulales bacterium]|jgi:acyl carrier protein